MTLVVTIASEVFPERAQFMEEYAARLFDTLQHCKAALKADKKSVAAFL